MIFAANSLRSLRLLPICNEDNEIFAKIIRAALIAFNANQPDSASDDTTTDNFFTLFQKERSFYIVAKLENKIVGGAGIYPTKGFPFDTCKLIRMHLIPEASGLGIGNAIISKCLDSAKNPDTNKYILKRNHHYYRHKDF